MFEYEDELLMNNSARSVGMEEMYYLCSVNNTADDQLAELARLVGSGGSSQEKTETITLVDTAPRLEFDLEQELSKAFASIQHTQPVGAEPALETVFAAPSPTAAAPATSPAQPVDLVQDQPHVEPIETRPIETAASAVVADVAKSDLDLDELISKEFALALQEEADQPVAEADAEYVDAIEKATDTFDVELARLMGSDQTLKTAAKMPPPTPEPTIAPPDQPMIVESAIFPTVSEPEVLTNSVSDSLPAQMSDFDAAHNQPATAHDAAVENTELASADHTDVTEISQGIDAVPGADAAEPIVQSEINIDELKESNPSFFDDQISIPAPHPAVLAKGNRNTGKRAAGSLIALALIAGAGLAGWNAMDGGGKSVPTILASMEPVKIKPKEAGGTVVPNQDQAVYRSVESSKKIEPKQKSLKDNSEKPIVVAKKVNTGAGKSETRIKRDELSTGAGPVLKPRKVRTVVVKPDGTILTQSSTEKAAPKLVSKSAPAKPKLAPKVVKIKKVKPKKVVAAKKPASAKKSEPAKKIAAVAKPAPVKKVAAKKPEPTKKVAAAAKSAPVKKPAPAKKVAAVKKPAPAKKVAAVKKPAPAKKVAAVKKPAPAKKVAAVKKPAPTKKVASVKKPVPAKKPNPVKKKTDSVKSTASVNSPYAVQVASQRSPEAAERTFKVLARRYASVFRGKGMDIRRADLKGKGIYYRARIPVQTKASARKLCQQLKAKGGDCFVTR